MTLEQWAYIGQIAASIAVVASLIYVVRQLHQNTNAMIVSNADNFVNFSFQYSPEDQNYMSKYFEA